MPVPGICGILPALHWPLAASLADLAGDVAVRVASPAVARAASLADLAGDVAVGVISPAVAGAASLADLAGDVVVGKASPAVAGAASLADLAGVVNIRVAPSAVDVVASPAIAGVVALADLAGGVTVGVASLADAGVASLANAGVASLAVLVRRTVVVVCHPMFGVRRCLRFRVIRVVNMLTMWAVALTVLTAWYRRALTVARSECCHLSRFVLSPRT